MQSYLSLPSACIAVGIRNGMIIDASNYVVTGSDAKFTAPPNTSMGSEN